MPREVAVYVATFERMDGPGEEILTVQGETACRAKNMAFVLIEMWKHQQGIPSSQWRLRSLEPK